MNCRIRTVHNQTTSGVKTSRRMYARTRCLPDWKVSNRAATSNTRTSAFRRIRMTLNPQDLDMPIREMSCMMMKKILLRVSFASERWYVLFTLGQRECTVLR